MKNILKEAELLVYDKRAKQYGSAKENFENIAKLWSIIIGKEITPKDVCLCMIQLKIARELNVPKRDNIIDGAGYFAVIEKIERGL